MNRTFIVLTIFILGMLSTAKDAEAQGKWSSEIPTEFRDAKQWKDTIDLLEKRDLYYGAMAAASRMIIFFNDLPSKEHAYKAIIRLVDMGYPYSTVGLFISGDIEPRDQYEFVNSYNLYKAILNKEKGMDRWAESYFSNVDKENFSKYLFYQALEEYSQGHLDKAEEILRKILAKKIGDDQVSFVRKTTRTLARVYFDKEDYKKSFDIYKTFLLKLNPVVPSDYLEAAWNLYYLKRYSEALGSLYNLESSLGDKSLDLERYTLRALIYKALCRTKNFETLGAAFQKQFGAVVEGLKRGESLMSYPQLKEFKVPGNAEYQQVALTVQELASEKKNLKDVPEPTLKLLNYLYDSEMRLLMTRARGLEMKALDRAAGQLLLMAEQLRFMKFEVARQKFNPDSVFIPSETFGDSFATSKDQEFRIRWVQLGDFWRDERLSYRGVVANQCTQ